MSDEYNALVVNGTWELVPSSLASNVIGCKWVYKMKLNPNGIIDRYKARLVVKGFHQWLGLDFHDTFSPVIKPITIRLLLSLAMSFGWSITHLDVLNAFLHDDLDEPIFIKQPIGFMDPSSPNHVCRLQKSLYGLKQSSSMWHHRLTQALLSYDFSTCKADISLYFLHWGSLLTFCLIYVDDLLVLSN